MSSDSPYNQGQNLSVAQAAIRLQEALKSLEGALTPMASRLRQLETVSEDSTLLQEDRARLARELDEAKSASTVSDAQRAEWAQKEQEFSELAGETMAELDAVIRQVQHALSQGKG